MSSSEELMKKRREYYRLLDNVKELTVSLSASYNDMEDAIMSCAIPNCFNE